MCVYLNMVLLYSEASYTVTEWCEVFSLKVFNIFKYIVHLQLWYATH